MARRAFQSVCMYSFVGWSQHDDVHVFSRCVVQWDRIEDKYAVTTLAVAAILGMWSAGGVVSVRTERFLSFSTELFLSLRGG